MILPAAAIKLIGVTAGACGESEFGIAAAVGLLLDPQPIPFTLSYHTLSDKVTDSQKTGQFCLLR